MKTVTHDGNQPFRCLSLGDLDLCSRKKFIIVISGQRIEIDATVRDPRPAFGKNVTGATQGNTRVKVRPNLGTE